MKAYFILLLVMLSAVLGANSYDYSEDVMITNYEVRELDGYQTLQIGNWDYMTKDRSYYLPVYEKVITLPIGSIVTDTSLVYEEPEQIDLNLACLLNEQVASRSFCTDIEPYIETYSFGLNTNTKVKILINPFKISDEDILFKKLHYTIKYLADSQISLDGIERSYEGYVGSDLTISLEIENMGSAHDTEIKVVESGKMIASKTVFAESGTTLHNISFPVTQSTRYPVTIKAEDNEVSTIIDGREGSAIITLGKENYEIGEPINFSVELVHVKNAKVHVTLSQGDKDVVSGTYDINQSFNFLSQPISGLVQGQYFISIRVERDELLKSRQGYIKIGSTTPAVQQASEQKPFNSNVIGILIAIALIILVVWVAYFFFRKR